jgi:hypothetical protein
LIEKKRKDLNRNIRAHTMQTSSGPDGVDLQWLVALVDMGMGMGVVMLAVDGVVVMVREMERGRKCRR